MSFDVELCSDSKYLDENQENFDYDKLQFSYSNNLETNHGCTLQVFKENLPSDAPVALCIGECGESVYRTGVLTLQLTYNTSENVVALLDVTSNIFQDTFKIAKDNGSKGVYLIGFGFGAFVAAKLLSDRQFFKDNNTSSLLQAAFLISGVYNIQKETIETVLSSSKNPHDSTSPCGSSPKSVWKKPSLVDNLMRDKQSFEDRNNLSFVCELNDKNPTFGEFFTNDLKKYKQDHGLHMTQKEAFINSPIYQSNIGESNIEKCDSIKDDKSKSQSPRLSYSVHPLISVDDLELFKSLSQESTQFSPLCDDFTHLCPMGIRLYVFAGENDCNIIREQSRVMYDCISDGCQTGNMHFQIKEKLSRLDMKHLFKEEDNFLKRLIRYDIVKNL